MKNLLILLLLGCSNNAITYAHMVDPYASCSSQSSAWDGCNAADTAYCTMQGKVYFCRGSSGQFAPSCTFVNNVVVEDTRMDQRK